MKKYHVNTTRNEMPTQVHQNIVSLWNVAEMKLHVNRTCFHADLKSQTGMSSFHFSCECTLKVHGSMDVYARFLNKESFMKDFIGVLKLDLWQTFLINVVHVCFFLLIIRIINDNMLPNRNINSGTWMKVYL